MQLLKSMFVLRLKIWHDKQKAEDSSLLGSYAVPATGTQLSDVSEVQSFFTFRDKKYLWTFYNMPEDLSAH
jgi:hypothetical protein